MFPSKLLVLFASVALSIAIAPPVSPPVQPPAAAEDPSPPSPPAAPVQPPVALPRNDMEDYMLSMFPDKRADIDVHVPREPHHPHARRVVDVKAASLCSSGTSDPDATGSDSLLGLSNLSVDLVLPSGVVAPPSPSQGSDTSGPLGLSNFDAEPLDTSASSDSPSPSPTPASSTPPPPPPPATTTSASDNSPPYVDPSSSDTLSSSTGSTSPLVTAVAFVPSVSAPSPPVSTGLSTSDLPQPTSFGVLASLGKAFGLTEDRTQTTSGRPVLDVNVLAPAVDAPTPSPDTSAIPSPTQSIPSSSSILPENDAVIIGVPLSLSSPASSITPAAAASAASSDRPHGLHLAVDSDSLSSGNKRRQVNATRRAELLPKRLVFIGGMTECTENGNGEPFSVDTSNDISHCGGCGNSCTNAMVEGASAVECNQGRCQAFACMGGYNNVLGVCIKSI